MIFYFIVRSLIVNETVLTNAGAQYATTIIFDLSRHSSF
jgi:hypothetical protein